MDWDLDLFLENFTRLEAETLVDLINKYTESIGRNVGGKLSYAIEESGAEDEKPAS